MRARRLALPVAILVAAIACMVAIAATARARPAETQPSPMLRPVGLLQARAQCPPAASLVECRAALRRALAAVVWQQKARRDDARRARGYGVDHALRLAAAIYGVPLGELRSVGSCESHLQPTSKNRTSSAAGLFQFLRSTWARAGVPGFSAFDPYANAIAAARLVHTDGSWREWSCQP